MCSPNTQAPLRRRLEGLHHLVLEKRCARVSAAPVHVDLYLERQMETEGKTLATAWSRLSVIPSAHRLGGFPDHASRPLAKTTLKRLAREYGKPRRQAKGLTPKPWRR